MELKSLHHQTDGWSPRDRGTHEGIRVEWILRAYAIRDAIYKAFYEALLEEGKGEEEAHETACYLIGEIDDETKK